MTVFNPTFLPRFAQMLPREEGGAHVLRCGRTEEEGSMEHKSIAAITWLFGAPFKDVCFFLAKTGILVISSNKKKNSFISSYEATRKEAIESGDVERKKLAESLPPLGGFASTQDDLSEELMKWLEEHKVDTLYLNKKEVHKGECAEIIDTLLATPKFTEKFPNEFSDFRPILSDILGPKSHDEQQSIKTASMIGCAIVQRIMIEKVITVIDKEIETKNRQLQEAVESEFELKRRLNQWKTKHPFDVESLELVYTSCQSGREFDIRPTSEPGRNKNLATKGPIILSLGLKYKDYCSSITRTLLIDPLPEQKSGYLALVKVMQVMIEKLALPDIGFNELYNYAKGALPEDLQSRFVPNAGFVVGLEFRDALLQISPKNDKKIKKDMSLCLSVGLQPTDSQQWALWITDTCVLTAQGPVLLTGSCKKDVDNVLYEFVGDDAIAAQASQAQSQAQAASAMIGNGKAPGIGAGGGTPGTISNGKAPGTILGKLPSLPPNAGPQAKAMYAQLLEQQKAIQVMQQARANAQQQIIGATTVNKQTRSRRECAQHLSAHMQLNVEQTMVQMELRKNKTEELKRRFANGYTIESTGNNAKDNEKKFDFASYKDPTEYPQIPKAVSLVKVYVDAEAEAVLVPIHNLLVPFGVKCIKSISVASAPSSIQDDVEKFSLRIIFYTPGGGGSHIEDYPVMPQEWVEQYKARAVAFAEKSKALKDAESDDVESSRDEANGNEKDEKEANGEEKDEKEANNEKSGKKKKKKVTAKDEKLEKSKSEKDSLIQDVDINDLQPRRIFIKELVYKSTEGKNFANVAQKFKDVQKTQRAREQEESARTGLVVQKALKFLTGRQPPCLRDINIRPSLGSRKQSGRVECHQNGLRFLANRNEYLDILFTNIDYAIFEPCINSVNTLLHFYLKNDVIINKKRTRNVQFFIEVLNTVEDLSKGLSAVDEHQEEVRERNLVNRINAAFRNFIENVHKIMLEENCTIQFEFPEQRLRFRGVPFRSNVGIMPTKNCLVALQEFPALVVPFADIELAVFERYDTELKEFDLILIQKDYTKPVIKISTIPTREFGDRLKSILIGQGIGYYTSSQSMKWNDLMKQVVKEIKSGEFQENGCWDAWFGNPEEAAEDEDSESQSESEYNPGSEESDGDAYAPSSDDSDISDDVPDDDSDDSGLDPNDSDDSSEGVDLDELEDDSENSTGGATKTAAKKRPRPGTSKVGNVGNKGRGRQAVANPQLVISNRQPVANTNPAPYIPKRREGRAFK